MTASAAATPRELSPEQIQVLLRKPPLWSRRDVQRSVAISLLRTIVVFGALGYLIGQSAGWAEVRRAFLSPSDFVDSFPMVWEGFLLNVRIFLIAEPIILAFGLLLAVVRSTRSPVLFPARTAAVVYVDVFRGAPALLVILTLGLGMPALRIEGLPTSAIFWGTLAIILSSSAYQAETFRAGIETVHASQRAAPVATAATSPEDALVVGMAEAIPFAEWG